jgi:hypothetical protein
MHWIVVFNGIADRWLWGFEADGWRLECHDPACGTLGIMPASDGCAPATIEDARWLADALAFDHDAPVGIRPAFDGVWPDAEPKDPAAHPAIEPVEPFGRAMTPFYWDSINQGYAAAAELRFNGSYVIRYDGEEDAPSTDFSRRFMGRKEWVGLYAMAARQPDPLAEYLCVYRVLEAMDKTNGKACSAAVLPLLSAHDFGQLDVACGTPGGYEYVNVFNVYRDRALQELERLAAAGVEDIAGYLYAIRNSLVHGKWDALTARRGYRATAAGKALPILKLIARVVIDQPSG